MRNRYSIYFNENSDYKEICITKQFYGEEEVFDFIKSNKAIRESNDEWFQDYCIQHKKIQKILLPPFFTSVHGIEILNPYNTLDSFSSFREFIEFYKQNMINFYPIKQFEDVEQIAPCKCTILYVKRCKIVTIKDNIKTRIEDSGFTPILPV